jgi:hypothetical protein
MPEDQGDAPEHTSALQAFQLAILREETLMGYPIILNGDHAEFEAQWAASGRPDNERPDWPLPSFDAQDWARAFCNIATGLGYRDAEGKPVDEGWMATWFANALMRGYDQRDAEQDLDPRTPEFGVAT